MWDNFKQGVVDLMLRPGLDPLMGQDLDTQVMALLQRARQAAVEGGGAQGGAADGAAGQGLQFSMGEAAPAADGPGTTETTNTTKPSGPPLSVEKSRTLITNVNNLAAQRSLTGEEWADLEQAKRVVAEDTVRRLERQAGPLTEVQKQELVETRKALARMAEAPKGPPHLTGTTKESADHKSYHYLLNPQQPEGRHRSTWFSGVLEFTQSNWSELARQIVFDPSTAIPTVKTPHGQKFEQPIIIRGTNGKVIRVTFVWIRNADGTERLVTSLPTGKKMIEEYSSVTLRKPIPDCDIPVGARGVVVMVHDANPPGYEVEFMDNSGKTLRDTKTGYFVFTLDEDAIVPVK